MKLHIVTVGKPRLPYAIAGFDEYAARLGRYHELRITHLADRYAADGMRLLQTAGADYLTVLDVEGDQRFSTPQLADFLSQRSLEGLRLCFMIGGPDGLPAEVTAAARARWSFGPLTLPHDLAMVVLAEALYRASSLNAGHPYHRA